ncbi:hypothetical protein BJQ89_03231 [Arthrobacter sp. ES1]|nr:hypothetical protein [Arthrobacter sp. ES1]
MAGFADKGALELAEQFFGGFGTVLINRIGPASGHAGQEVRVVLRGGAGQGVLHLLGGRGIAEVPDPVQGQGDDGRGPGPDFAGGHDGAEFRVPGRKLLAAESLSRQERAG